MGIHEQTTEPRQLVILADGGSLSDLNDRLVSDGAPKKDFAQIPESMTNSFLEQEASVTCPVGSRIFCTIASGSARSFVSKMEKQWTVRAFPLSYAKYERGAEKGGSKHEFRTRFHAYLGYALGIMTGSTPPGQQCPIVTVVTDDPHLLPCMSDSRAAGIDARLAWWRSSIGQDVSFLAARNGVPILWLSDEADAPTGPADKRDAALEGLLGAQPTQQ